MESLDQKETGDEKVTAPFRSLTPQNHNRAPAGIGGGLPFSPGRASSFWHGSKGTKSALFCRRVPASPMVCRVSSRQTSSFSHARKGTKSAHRGTNPSDKGRPPGFIPLCTPGLRESRIGAVSSFRRAPADTPCHLWRPAAFCAGDLLPCSPPTGA